MTRPAFALALAVLIGAVAPAWAEERETVTVDNFIRAESDRYFAMTAANGGFGKFFHRRELYPIDRQIVVRGNRDTIYSAAVFDLEAGSVTVTLPDAGSRFRSMIAIDQNHEAHFVAYKAGKYMFKRKDYPTRYIFVALRIFVDPRDEGDMKAAFALQDATVVRQISPGRLELPAWDKASLARVRGALSELGATIPDMSNAFGRAGQVDPVHRLIATAVAWGGNPDKDAAYLNVVPDRNDGKTIYRLRVGKVPVRDFWSVSVYNKAGYFEANELGAYSLNNLTAEREADGTVLIRFGGCDGKVPNCLPTTPGWNYLVRLYRPATEVLDGGWRFPQAYPVETDASPAN